MAAQQGVISEELSKELQSQKDELNGLHLRKLIFEQGRGKLVVEADGVTLDFTRQRMTTDTHNLLLRMAEETGVANKIKQMAAGERINSTENRAVMHMDLRAQESDSYEVDGKDVVGEVHKVLKRVRKFSDEVRTGVWKGATGKPLINILSVGIGGSYLGAEFVLEALRTDAGCAKAAAGRSLKFMANVDPIGFGRATASLDPETTLVIVISKSFRTKETMLNANLCRQWIVNALGEDAVSKHVISCSANPDLAVKFGIQAENVFGFWDWV